MKTYFVCNLLLLIQGTMHDKVQDDVILYTDIGSDVILKCNVTNTTRLRWRRENEIISYGLKINPELQHRLKIIRNKSLGEYNLQILDLAERDLGSYWCQHVINDVVNEKQVVIKLTEHQTTNSQVDISTDIITNTEFKNTQSMDANNKEKKIIQTGKTDYKFLATYTLVCCGLTVLTLFSTLLYKYKNQHFICK